MRTGEQESATPATPPYVKEKKTEGKAETNTESQLHWQGCVLGSTNLNERVQFPISIRLPLPFTKHLLDILTKLRGFFVCPCSGSAGSVSESVTLPQCHQLAAGSGGRQGAREGMCMFVKNCQVISYLHASASKSYLCGCACVCRCRCVCASALAQMQVSVHVPVCLGHNGPNDASNSIEASKSSTSISGSPHETRTQSSTSIMKVVDGPVEKIRFVERLVARVLAHRHTDTNTKPEGDGKEATKK